MVIQTLVSMYCRWFIRMVFFNVDIDFWFWFYAFILVCLVLDILVSIILSYDVKSILLIHSGRELINLIIIVVVGPCTLEKNFALPTYTFLHAKWYVVIKRLMLSMFRFEGMQWMWMWKGRKMFLCTRGYCTWHMILLKGLHLKSDLCRWVDFIGIPLTSS